MEVEYVVLLYTGIEAHWYHNLFTELRFPQNDLLII